MPDSNNKLRKSPGNQIPRLFSFPILEKGLQTFAASVFNKSAYFIEKGITRSFWLVNGEE